MSNRINIAHSAGEREAIFRFRYEVYIEELHKIHLDADHFNKLMYDEGDALSKLYYAANDEGMMATVRVQYGSKGKFSAKENSLYDIEVFEEYIPHKLTGITDRLMVKKEYRRSFITHEIMQATYIDALRAGMKLSFICCEEKLLPMYFRYGFRMYGEPASVNLGEKRYRLVIVTHDRQHLEKMRSPFLHHLPESLDDKGYTATLLHKKSGITLTHSLQHHEENFITPRQTNRA